MWEIVFSEMIDSKALNDTETRNKVEEVCDTTNKRARAIGAESPSVYYFKKQGVEVSGSGDPGTDGMRRLFEYFEKVGGKYQLQVNAWVPGEDRTAA